MIHIRIAAKMRRVYFIDLFGIPIVVTGLILLFAIPASHAQQQNTQEALSSDGPKAQYTAEGTENCVRCHVGERIVSIAKTVHGNKEDPHTPYAKNGCESCHGPGSDYKARKVMLDPEAARAAGLVMIETADGCTQCHN